VPITNKKKKKKKKKRNRSGLFYQGQGSYERRNKPLRTTEGGGVIIDKMNDN
jgi:hypothetical protein